MPDLVLLGDLSGDANVRLALAAPGQRPKASQRYDCRSLEDLGSALDDYLGAHDDPPLIGAAFAACGWERNGGLSMPNHNYSIQRSWLLGRLNVKRLNLVNDCVSKGLAIERLLASEKTPLIGGESDPSQPRAMIGVANGLGTVVLLTDEFGRVTALPCEGGHSDLPVQSDRERLVLKALARKYGHVSRERAISLPGLVDLWQSLVGIDGGQLRTASPADVVAMARSRDPHAAEAVAMSVGWLAATASDLALICGARGGIYLAGDYFALIGGLLDRDAFAARFGDKGRLSDYVREIPVNLVNAPEPELIGLTTLFG